VSHLAVFRLILKESCFLVCLIVCWYWKNIFLVLSPRRLKLVESISYAGPLQVDAGSQTNIDENLARITNDYQQMKKDNTVLMNKLKQQSSWGRRLVEPPLCLTAWRAQSSGHSGLLNMAHLADISCVLVIQLSLNGTGAWLTNMSAWEQNSLQIIKSYSS